MNIEAPAAINALVAEPEVAEQIVGDRAASAVYQPLPVIWPRNTRMRRVLDRARRMAGESAAILLLGECGVGKSMMAALIHQWGPHANGCLITLRATSEAPPETLEEANALFNRANGPEVGGTLVLDEIGDYSLPRQDKLLSLLHAQATQSTDPDRKSRRIQIVATSSLDLAAGVKRGIFREELHSFLMDNSLHLPPLRERPEDITGFAEEMLAHFAAEHHRFHLTLEPEAKLAIAHYDWPGNLHELRNAIERAVLKAKRAAIGESEFKFKSVPDSGCNRAGEFLSLDALEKQQILRVIRAAPTLEEAARILHVDITTLWRKRRRYGI